MPVSKVAGFSLYADLAARADQRQTLEWLCRHIGRPAIPEKRLSLALNRNVRPLHATRSATLS
ncbi:MAG: transposase [Gammaproteobacteria bacterium]|nr:transposase [Gammaproteobacteria bacterium]